MENVKNGPRKEFFARPRIYKEQLITLEDLNDFKRQLFFELRTMFKDMAGQPAPKKWLRSSEVRKMLNISPGTLQTLRSRCILPYTRIQISDSLQRMKNTKDNIWKK
jgi:hypothetical protein